MARLGSLMNVMMMSRALPKKPAAKFLASIGFRGSGFRTEGLRVDILRLMDQRRTRMMEDQMNVLDLAESLVKL